MFHQAGGFPETEAGHHGGDDLRDGGKRMTARQTDAITDPQSIIAALQQRLDAALAREAALAEELAARDAALAERKQRLRRAGRISIRNNQCGQGDVLISERYGSRVRHHPRHAIRLCKSQLGGLQESMVNGASTSDP